MADYISQLHLPKLLDDAEAAEVVWARVKGFPFWPAQQLSDAAAAKRLGKVQHKRNFSVPVMFFGTLEIAWVGIADVVSLREGVEEGLIGKGKQASFQKALAQVAEFLTVDGKRRAPVKWWCRPPNSVDEDEDAPEVVPPPKDPLKGQKRDAPDTAAAKTSKRAAPPADTQPTNGRAKAAATAVPPVDAPSAKESKAKGASVAAARADATPASGRAVNKGASSSVLPVDIPPAVRDRGRNASASVPPTDVPVSKDARGKGASTSAVPAAAPPVRDRGGKSGSSSIAPLDVRSVKDKPKSSGAAPSPEAAASSAKERGTKGASTSVPAVDVTAKGKSASTSASPMKPPANGRVKGAVPAVSPVESPPPSAPRGRGGPAVPPVVVPPPASGKGKATPERAPSPATARKKAAPPAVAIPAKERTKNAPTGAALPPVSPAAGRSKSVTAAAGARADLPSPTARSSKADRPPGGADGGSALPTARSAAPAAAPTQRNGKRPAPAVDNDDDDSDGSEEPVDKKQAPPPKKKQAVAANAPSLSPGALSSKAAADRASTGGTGVTKAGPVNVGAAKARVRLPKPSGTPQRVRRSPDQAAPANATSPAVKVEDVDMKTDDCALGADEAGDAPTASGLAGQRVATPLSASTPTAQQQQQQQSSSVSPTVAEPLSSAAGPSSHAEDAEAVAAVVEGAVTTGLGAEVVAPPHVDTKKGRAGRGRGALKQDVKQPPFAQKSEAVAPAAPHQHDSNLADLSATAATPAAATDAASARRPEPQALSQASAPASARHLPLQQAISEASPTTEAVAGDGLNAAPAGAAATAVAELMEEDAASLHVHVPADTVREGSCSAKGSRLQCEGTADPVAMLEVDAPAARVDDPTASTSLPKVPQGGPDGSAPALPHASAADEGQHFGEDPQLQQQHTSTRRTPGRSGVDDDALSCDMSRHEAAPAAAAGGRGVVVVAVAEAGGAEIEGAGEAALASSAAPCKLEATATAVSASCKLAPPPVAPPVPELAASADLSRPLSRKSLLLQKSRAAVATTAVAAAPTAASATASREQVPTISDNTRSSAPASSHQAVVNNDDHASPAVGGAAGTAGLSVTADAAAPSSACVGTEAPHRKSEGKPAAAKADGSKSDCPAAAGTGGSTGDQQRSPSAPDTQVKDEGRAGVAAASGAGRVEAVLIQAPPAPPPPPATASSVEDVATTSRRAQQPTLSRRAAAAAAAAAALGKSSSAVLSRDTASLAALVPSRKSSRARAAARAAATAPSDDDAHLPLQPPLPMPLAAVSNMLLLNVDVPCRAPSSAGLADSGSESSTLSGGQRRLPLRLPAPLPSVRDIKGFKWPQTEPSLPKAQTAFCLPTDWLLERPPQYETLKRNVYVSRRRPARLGKEEVSVCCCRSPPLAVEGQQQRLGCGDSCLNRASFVHCDSRSCPCGELCSNRPFPVLRGPTMEPFLTNNRRGYGVRALEHVQSGRFVVEYVGEVIDESELKQRMGDDANGAGAHSFYYMELGDRLFIDARRKGSVARLINSSCDPNCETQKWHDAGTGETRVGIFARRDIAPGEEFTYNYLTEQYGNVGGAAFKCRCGALTCRGVMDYNPEKRKDNGRRIEVFWDGDGVFYRGTVVSYSPTSRKHTIVYDDGDKERVCLEEVQHRWLDAGADEILGTLVTSPPLLKATQRGRASMLQKHKTGGEDASLPHSAVDADEDDAMADIPVRPSPSSRSMPPPSKRFVADSCTVPDGPSTSYSRHADAQPPYKKWQRGYHSSHHNVGGGGGHHASPWSPHAYGYSACRGGDHNGRGGGMMPSCDGLESLLQAAEAAEGGRDVNELLQQQPLAPLPPPDGAEEPSSPRRRRRLAPPVAFQDDDDSPLLNGGVTARGYGGGVRRPSAMRASAGGAPAPASAANPNQRPGSRTAGIAVGNGGASGGGGSNALSGLRSPSERLKRAPDGAHAAPLSAPQLSQQQPQQQPLQQQQQASGGRTSGPKRPAPSASGGGGGAIKVEDVLGIRLPSCGLPLFQPPLQQQPHGGKLTVPTALQKGLLAYQHQQQHQQHQQAAPRGSTPPHVKQVLLDTPMSALVRPGAAAATAATVGWPAPASAPAALGCNTSSGQYLLSGSMGWLDSPALSAGQLAAALRLPAGMPNLFKGDAGLF